MLFNVLKHPIAAYIVLMATTNAEKSTMIAYHCTTELGNITLKINQILRLFMCNYIIKVNIFVTPLKIMNDPLIGKFFLNNENVLEELNYPFVNVKVVEFGNHCFLVLQIKFVFVDKSVSFINHVSDVVE